MTNKLVADVAGVAAQKYWNASDAQVVVTAWRRSGQSMEAFARTHGIHAHRLSRWARQLRRVAAETPTFHPVRVVRTPSLVADERMIEIRLEDVTIRLPSGFAATDLQQVLAVLDGRASC